ncbi:MAG: U32 family peptidase [Candidatus Izemoplasmatales bacterium]|nr:U32 family peptidase [Candidatus Izemoplasmatales bacterium]
MAKIIVDLLSSNISKYQKASGVVVNSKEFSCFPGKVFSETELLEISEECRKEKKLAILNIDRLVEEHELEELKGYLDKVIHLFDYFIFSDMAVYAFFEEKKALRKLVYDAKTIVASSFDLDFYKKQGSKCFLNNELSFEEILEIASKEKFSFEVYGYHQIFYSKRELLSLYEDFKEEKWSLQNIHLLLKEELRQDMYSIYQGRNGTFIYTPYIYAMFDEILKIKNRLEFVRINATFLDEENILKVVNCYYHLLKGQKVSLDDLKRINPNISSGFLKNKSILLKDSLLERVMDDE